MIKSMTGYGRGRVLADGLDVSFEVKSVNNRYMDLNIRMPRVYAPLEERVKALVGAAISRGKVDVYIGVEHLNGECVQLSLNREYLEGYLGVLGQIGREYGISGEVTLAVRCFLPARPRRMRKRSGFSLNARRVKRWTRSLPCGAQRAESSEPTCLPGLKCCAESPRDFPGLRPKRCEPPMKRWSHACVSSLPARRPTNRGC